MPIRKYLLCLALLCSGAATAGPGDYVYTPTVEMGEREIEFKAGTAKNQDGSRRTDIMMGLGYGANEFWFTELYLKREREGGEGLTLAEWENKFQLTETGQYFVDLGLITEVEAPLNDGNAPYEFKLGPLLQKEFGKTQVNANLLFERKFGPREANEPHVTEIGYQWQIKYRLKPELEFGAQGFGEMGKWNDWERANDQNHRLGPAIFGKFALGAKQAIKYDVAVLFGVSQPAPDHTFRMQAEYEF